MPKCAPAAFLRGFVASPDGTRMAHAELSGAAADPEALGLQLAAELRRQGAAEILAALGGPEREPGRTPCRGDAPGRAGGAFRNGAGRAGAIPVLYPVLEIRDTRRCRAAARRAIRLDDFDLAVFVSPNAIEQALARSCRAVPGQPACAWPPWARAANGNWRGTGSPTSSRRNLRFDSEALLELPELTEVAGQARDHLSRRGRSRAAGRNPQGNAAPPSNT
jgi:hypothetical protein